MSERRTKRQNADCVCVSCLEFICHIENEHEGLLSIDLHPKNYT